MKPETAILIKRVSQLRSDLPEYKVGDTESKDLINAYHNTISLLVEQIRAVEELPNYGTALSFVDRELKERGEQYVA